MEFLDAKKSVASNIGYVDSSGDILTGKDITETDIGVWMNQRYLDELFPLLSVQYPEDFRREGKFNFYKATGTVAAGSTSYTLVASSSIFNNGMVGDKVYNSTDEESAIITAYTSATTVTVDTEIGDDWDGDTIYVLGHVFGLGGNAVDSRNILQVGVKYDTDDTYYRTCEYIDQNEAFRNGNETYSELFPRWFPTTVTIDDVPTTAIGILPEPSENVANGVKISYNEQPAELSDDEDVPRLPLGSHSLLVMGTTANALRKLMRLDEADRFEQMYQAGKAELIINYALTRASGTPKVKASGKLYRMNNRII